MTSTHELRDDDGMHQQNISKNGRQECIQAEEEPTKIQRFYSEASVLVTGATGYMGKVLIEKLLRSCPDIHSIYVMVREKKGRSLDDRIEDLTSSPCFEVIKREQPAFRSKLHVVAGDIGLKGLGISDSDKHLLEQQINVVFHVAATVRFDEHLKLAVLQNVRGTREVLDLCRTFKHLKSLIYVSTAYSNCPKKEIDEQFYAPPFPSDHIIHMAESLDINTLDRLSQKLMGDWPNTYTFTKAISEDIVRNYGKELPIAVFRPSIVVCTRSEPMKGWIDNMYGPTGVMVGASSGLIRTLNLDDDIEANIVPCDMAINALIATAWDIAENRITPEIPVYNYVATKTNPIFWGSFIEQYLSHCLKSPISRAIWVPMLITIKNMNLYLMFRVLVHFIPALLMDLGLAATNKPPQMVKIYDKVHKFSMVLSYFATQQWDFESKNVDGMWKRLSYRDKQLFSFDMDSLDWSRYIKESCPGLRLYILQDPVSTVPEATAKLNRFMILHRLIKGVIVITAFWISMQVLPLFWTLLWSAVEHRPQIWKTSDFISLSTVKMTPSPALLNNNL